MGKRLVSLILASCLAVAGPSCISSRPITNEQKKEIIEIKETENIDINTEEGRKHYKTTAETQLKYAKEYDEQGIKLNAMFCYFEAGKRFVKLDDERAKECYNYLVNSIYSEKADELFLLMQEKGK